MNAHSPKDLIRRLREQLGRQEAVTLEDVTLLSSGTPMLDRLLPGGGLRHGMLVEWLAEPAGSGAITLSLLAAREACRQGGALVVIDRERTFYPPAAAAWGIDLARLIVVHPQTARDALWAAVQSLRSPAVAAMWIAVDRLDDRAFRRLQLAASDGRTLGLLLRPANIRGQPSWADITLTVGLGGTPRAPGDGRGNSLARRPRPSPTAQGRATQTHRHLQVHILRSRGVRPGGHVTLEIDDVTHTVRALTPDTRHLTPFDAHPLPVVTELANPTAATRPARA